ncbi:MAG: hypothetical protein WAM14_08400 [Candidatus Nitrosopolaris sp.]
MHRSMLASIGITTGSVQAYWGYGGYGEYYHHWGLGYGYNSWYWQARQNGYSQGFSDGSNNNSYDSSGHTSVYCGSYGHGYADGQTHYNNGQQPRQNQGQTQHIFFYKRAMLDMLQPIDCNIDIS